MQQHKVPAEIIDKALDNLKQDTQLRITLRFLLGKWREESAACGFSILSQMQSETLTNCAKELEEALK